jgi:hypothetical protein
MASVPLIYLDRRSKNREMVQTTKTWALLLDELDGHGDCVVEERWSLSDPYPMRLAAMEQITDDIKSDAD